jgi:hypothetical protein
VSLLLVGLFAAGGRVFELHDGPHHVPSIQRFVSNRNELPCLYARNDRGRRLFRRGVSRFEQKRHDRRRLCRYGSRQSGQSVDCLRRRSRIGQSHRRQGRESKRDSGVLLQSDMANAFFQQFANYSFDQAQHDDLDGRRRDAFQQCVPTWIGCGQSAICAGFRF